MSSCWHRCYEGTHHNHPAVFWVQVFSVEPFIVGVSEVVVEQNDVLVLDVKTLQRIRHSVDVADLMLPQDHRKSVMAGLVIVEDEDATHVIALLESALLGTRSALLSVRFRRKDLLQPTILVEV